MDSRRKAIIGIYASADVDQHALGHLAADLQLPIIDTSPLSMLSEGLMLVLNSDNTLWLYTCGPSAPGPIKVDFVRGGAAHRRQFGGGKGQLIAKAIGLKSNFKPTVLDVTAGLGRDAFVLATLGCEVALLERHPVVFHLLKNGLQRAAEATDDALREIVSRLTLCNVDGCTYLADERVLFDVIYLDPMFPERHKSARVKKEMFALHHLVGHDLDAGELLQRALTKARYRVVVKRPRKSPTIAQHYPALNLVEAGFSLQGKTTRYDIYPIGKMP